MISTVFLRALAAATLLCICLLTTEIRASTEHWTLHQYAELPDWLRFSVQHRTRYEGQANAFRRNTNGGDQVLAFRTQVFIEATHEGFSVGAEFIDSRITLETDNTPVNNSLVNDVALLQAYLAWQTKDLVGSGLGAAVKFGRQTMDIGSRRFVARNRFRNTINNFNGIDFILGEGDHWQWRSFVVLPVTRLPTNQQAIRDNVGQFDKETFENIFAGSFFSIRELPLDSVGEFFFFQLSENDSIGIPTRDRHLSTPGARWYRAPRPNDFDFELEAAVQTGTSRGGSAVTDTVKLDNFAYFGHVSIGYSFDLPWAPRLVLQYDYASGDADPFDNKNGRFDTLFGARRFEYGPTSIWGAFARSNINTPGLRVLFAPMPGLSGFIAHRAFWLAEKRDTWVGSNLRDVTGQSGSFIGQQLEARLRWDAVPGTVRLETGWAHLFKGPFAKKAPGAPADKSDADYFYVQTSFSF